MNIHILSKEALVKALNIRDLSNPEEGEHAIQLLIDKILSTLEKAWNCELHLYRETPIVSVYDNYDRLRYPEDGPARATRYTRYVCDTALLRTSTSAVIPRAMQALSDKLGKDDLIACPGLVYRRDSIDRMHLGEIHQMDLWRITPYEMKSKDLHEMILLVIQSVLPGIKYRVEKRIHPYTLEGLQIDVLYGDEWVELGECGLAHPEIIKENLPQLKNHTGLAMGLGLDRILMVRKGLKDIRLVASTHPEIAGQMKDLNPYREISSMPAVRRDISLVLNRAMDAEEMGDIVRERLGNDARLIESLQILADTPYDQLPEHVLAKLGMEKGQRNTLLRVVFRALDRTLTDADCNQYRDQIYACLHRGKHWEWSVR